MFNVDRIRERERMNETEKENDAHCITCCSRTINECLGKEKGTSECILYTLTHVF